MIAPIAPAFCALKTFAPNSHVPRWIRAIFPVSAPAGSGLHPIALLPAASAGTYSAGPTCWPTIDGPNVAGPVSRPVRFAGTGVGAVTFTVDSISVAYFVTAPTAITLGEAAGRLPVAVAGPLLPSAKTPTTPASVAASAAWTIGSGQSSVFWWLEPHEFESTSAPSATASSSAFTISTTQPFPFSNASGLELG